MKNKLNRSTRGMDKYLDLKKDYEENPSRLFDSLPLFYRIMYLDEPNPWVNEINRFDFLGLVSLSSDIEEFKCLENTGFEFKEIKLCQRNDSLILKLEDFFLINILKKKGITLLLKNLFWPWHIMVEYIWPLMKIKSYNFCIISYLLIKASFAYN